MRSRGNRCSLAASLARVTESREMRDWKGICDPRRRRPVGKYACPSGDGSSPACEIIRGYLGARCPSEGSANALKLQALV